MNQAEAWGTALERVLEHEGGFVNDPDDPGGATNYGISLRFLRDEASGDPLLKALYDFDNDGEIDADDIAELSIEDAAQIYKRAFWDRYDYGSLPSIVAVKVFDMAVNMGPRQAGKILQRALIACSRREIAPDGVIGPKTRKAVNDVVNSWSAMALLVGMRCECAGFYRILIAQKPVFAKYRTGWLRRAYS